MPGLDDANAAEIFASAGTAVLGFTLLSTDFTEFVMGIGELTCNF